MSDLVAARSPYVDGTWITGSRAQFAVESPATTETIATVAESTPAVVEQAIHAARRAFDQGPWTRLTGPERVEAVRRLGGALHARRDQLVETIIAEAGCPRGITEYAQVDLALASIEELIESYLGLPEWEHTAVPLSAHLVGSSVRLSICRYEPTGVASAITPYTFPFITNVWKVVPALLAGCAVVLRPSPLTPLSGLVFGEAADEAELPPGVLNVVPESGNQGAVMLSSHPAVDVVSFTGSTGVGRAIAAQAAPTLKRLILELGGKSVQLHLPDQFAVGVERASGAALPVFVSNAGQGCALQTRVLVPDEHRQAVAETIASMAAGLSIGDPSSSATMVGPLISEAQRDRVQSIVTAEVEAGGRLVGGGRRPEQPERGWYFEPTVLDSPSNKNPSAQQEIFGPVVTVLGYESVDQAIDIANDHELGLSGGVYTDDLTQGVAVAERIRSGTVQVNTIWASGHTPMGGLKQSGYGRERGAPGIRAFQELKHLVIGSR